MEVAFDSQAIRKLCEDAAHANLELGAKVAEALIRRVADLWAATTVSDLLAGKPHQVDEHMVIDLSDGYMMAFAANHIKNPLNSAGSIMWHKVSRVKILEILK